MFNGGSSKIQCGTLETHFPIVLPMPIACIVVDAAAEQVLHYWYGLPNGIFPTDIHSANSPHRYGTHHSWSVSSKARQPPPPGRPSEGTPPEYVSALKGFAGMLANSRQLLRLRFQFFDWALLSSQTECSVFTRLSRFTAGLEIGRELMCSDLTH